MSCFRCWGIGCYFCPGSGHSSFMEAKRMALMIPEEKVSPLLSTAEDLSLPDAEREKAYAAAIEAAVSPALKGHVQKMKDHFYHTNR